jgi:hypothetical protein
MLENTIRHDLARIEETLRTEMYVAKDFAVGSELGISSVVAVTDEHIAVV